jgi:UDP-N-acetylbacillosamine transaminase
MAKIDEVSEICRQFGVTLIEDSAESLGATFRGKQSGTFGDFGVYSFNGNKILTTSGGGILIGRDSEKIKKANFLSTQAREQAQHYEHNEFGYNYRMSNILASVGVAQMEVLSDRVNKRRQIFNWYWEELGEAFNFMPEIENSRGNRWLTTVSGLKDVNRVIKALHQESIESRPLWKPMHQQPLFKDTSSTLNGVSDSLFSSGLCLPSGTAMDRSDIQRVSKIVRENV